MTDTLIIIAVLLSALAALFAFLAFQRSKAGDANNTDDIVPRLFLPLEERIQKLEQSLQQKFATDAAFNREENSRQARDLRDEQSQQANKLREEVRNSMAQLAEGSRGNFETLSGAVRQQLADFAAQLDKLSTSQNALLVEAQKQAKADHAQSRTELNETLKRFSDTLGERTKELDLRLQSNSDRQTLALKELTVNNETSLTKIREAVEKRLEEVQRNNNEQLEKMRQTVDEKLQSTLEKRLGESFQMVSDRLEQVHKGLGEMQSLATGVGDLKRVLTNVKSRGGFGEVQLATLLEEMLTADQFDKNVKAKPRSNDLVEFAIKLPGRNGDGTPVYLPIDAKFPTEDYERLLLAHDAGDKAAETEALKGLKIRIIGAAKDIRDKYIEPPHTTDFGIMYLPTEGLYAEVLRIPGLSAQLQSEYRVIPTGPTTLSAILSSLQMGFRTLAVEKRSSEVWETLKAVKTEFGNFGKVLESVHKKIQSASSEIEVLRETRTRAMDRKLRGLESLPAEEATRLLGTGAFAAIDDEPIEE